VERSEESTPRPPGLKQVALASGVRAARAVMAARPSA